MEEEEKEEEEEEEEEDRSEINFLSAKCLTTTLFLLLLLPSLDLEFNSVDRMISFSPKYIWENDCLLSFLIWHKSDASTSCGTYYICTYVHDVFMHS